MPSDKRARKREGRQARQEAVRRAEERARRNRQIRNAGIAVALLVGAVFLITRFQGGDDKTVTAGAGSADCPDKDGSSAKRSTFEGPPKMCIDVKKTYRAIVATDAGSFTITLDAKAAPKTVNNFVFLARYRYYEDVTFHRVIPGFVVQGGDPEGTGSGGPGYQFDDELPKAGAYKVGSVAMANSGPNTNGSQFFVVTGPQGVALPPNYSLFGTVTAGMSVVKKIEADGSPGGTPKVKHTIKSVTIRES